MALIVINRPVVQCSEHDPAPRSPWRRRALFAGALAIAVAATAGATGALAGGGGQNTTSVAFVNLTVAKKVLNNASIAANKTVSATVIGGSTTVPTDATTVQLTVTASGTANGILNFYPAGNVGGGSGQFITWTAGHSGSGIIQENPGQVGQLTFYNVSNAAAHVTATITGYSTQVTAGDINGSGGSAGQALINNGDGTAGWGSAAPGSYTHISLPTTHFTGLNFVQVAAVTVPAGDYNVTYTGVVTNSGASPDTIYCYINGVAPVDVGQIVEKTVVPANSSNEIVAQAVTKAATAGSITVTCADDNGTSSVGVLEFPILTAVAVNANGVYSNN